MDKEIAVITLHGMGDYKPNYFAGLRGKLINQLKDDWAKVAFVPIQYQPILQQNQNELWQRMEQYHLGGTLFRRFLLFGLSDAGSLEHSSRTSINDQYVRVQLEIVRALDEAHAKLGNSNKPVVLVAQSLGCQVISNYIWDAQNNQGVFDDLEPDAPQDVKMFRRLDSCKYLLTTGCNIPLFVGGLDPIKPIHKLSDEFVWDNYFDKDDVLGWPLSPLSDEYGELVDDHAINAGGIFTSWTPLSHGQYWTDENVIQPLIRRIKAYI